MSKLLIIVITSFISLNVMQWNVDVDYWNAVISVAVANLGGFWLGMLVSKSSVTGDE